MEKSGKGGVGYFNLRVIARDNLSTPTELSHTCRTFRGCRTRFRLFIAPFLQKLGFYNQKDKDRQLQIHPPQPPYELRVTQYLLYSSTTFIIHLLHFAPYSGPVSTEFSHRICLFICGRRKLPVSGQPKPRYRLVVCAQSASRLLPRPRPTLLLPPAAPSYSCCSSSCSYPPQVIPIVVLGRTHLYSVPRPLLPITPHAPLNARSQPCISTSHPALIYPADTHKVQTPILYSRPILLHALESTVLVLPSLPSTSTTQGYQITR